MLELRIKKKYFDAILELKKPFELRHEPIKKGTIVKLNEVRDMTEKEFELNYNNCVEWDIIKKSILKWNEEEFKKASKYLQLSKDKQVELMKKYNRPLTIDSGRYIIFESGECYELIEDKTMGDPTFFTTKDRFYTFDKEFNRQTWSWYDNFCWDYINEKQTYLIEIARFIEICDGHFVSKSWPFMYDKEVK